MCGRLRRPAALEERATGSAAGPPLLAPPAVTPPSVHGPPRSFPIYSSSLYSRRGQLRVAIVNAAKATEATNDILHYIEQKSLAVVFLSLFLMYFLFGSI